MTLNEVLKNTNYDVSLFSEEARKYVEDAIVVKTIRGKESLFIKCLKRDKEIALMKRIVKHRSEVFNEIRQSVSQTLVAAESRCYEQCQPYNGNNAAGIQDKVLL